MPKLIDSPVLKRVVDTPPVSWIIRSLTRYLVRRQLRQEAVINLPPREEFAAKDLNSTLNAIVVDMVETLGYVGAMVATYEQGDCLPVRAYYIDPHIASMERIAGWEKQISDTAGIPISLSNPEIARVYRYDRRCQDNLSIRAVEESCPIISDDLYSLFTPVVPAIGQVIVEGIQEALNIEQVIAVPFFVDDQTQPVGNLFVAKRGFFTDHDQRILAAVCRQAAIALESERRRLEIEIIQDMVFKIQSNLQDETKILHHIVQGVVDRLGFVGAMVATFEESDRSLPIRSYAIDPKIAPAEKITHWEERLSELSGKPVSISNPDIARVYLSDHKNLSVQAWLTGEPVFSDSLFDLLTPVVPDTPVTREAVEAAQEEMGIKQLIVVPFFAPNETGSELVGNLFAATRSRQFTDSEVRMLMTFGQQAAVGIKNARLYNLSEERRRAAQVFGKMAFSAAAYIHELRNHISYAILNLQLTQNINDYEPAFQDEIRAAGPKILDRLKTTSSILAQLHEPWRQSPDIQVDINRCIVRAIEKATREKTAIVPVTVLQENLPPVFTSHDMLTEAFRAILKYSFESLEGYRREDGEVVVESSYNPMTCEIQVKFRDNGPGIRSEHISRIFEIRSTKTSSTGFGLFWAKEYIDNLKGRIEVISTVGAETEFRVILPVIN